ncbi:septal ring lytic transglycosylase RlpA family protein [Chelativorans sp. SCAU2101]|uniref:Endolytic peptidoglycan transglycosylase RlpA n=1 Tax=Chelativorans petroleitrophicus TaxID=2975484 RepID=A0A9X2X7J0_9HYPH|nr:septal ring lytic transglycosylase RlpA family protein [Chelativorans petroleitrophicus]MCT8989581.1 septal ring lytic transglycosylase RlpA family protein [Chelativorans petroleitrophicus]
MGKEQAIGDSRAQSLANHGNHERRHGWAWALAGTAILSILLAGCGAPTPKATLSQTGEYFAESEYGVKASPRIASVATSEIPRGGGRYKLGKPYQVKGRWYKPADDPDYVAEGKASWYGAAFHGRLTANGEIYDMAHLTAAHPTLPLPSYARVTNLDNGSSVIVRVNDRGPFAHGRIIDLSKRAAELLDYRNAGIANVRVEYVGPAPLHGQDAQFLLASYRPGGALPDPSDGLPTGVMVAMNGPTPSQPVSQAVAALAEQAAPISLDGGVALPAVGPLVPDRPTEPPVQAGAVELALLSYADRRVSRAASAFDAVLDSQLDSRAVIDWWERRNGAQTPDEIAAPYINLGTWASRAEAERLTRALAELGRPVLKETVGPGGKVYVASLLPDGEADLDAMLRAAWAAGALDAFAVRD